MTKRERYLSAQIFFLTAATNEYKKYKKTGDAKALERFSDLMKANGRAAEKHLKEVGIIESGKMEKAL